MSRVAKAPIPLPKGVEINLQDQLIRIKGKKGELSYDIHALVECQLKDNVLSFSPRNQSNESNALAGTMRAVISNLVQGVDQGFEKKLILVGVGYRALLKENNILNLTLGFSHPVDFSIPEGITIEVPTPTEIIIKGTDKQKVGQVATNIRTYRVPEPYKGKGVRHADEKITLKETKKNAKKK
jgi:large subunit ribosomal protein L6